MKKQWKRALCLGIGGCFAWIGTVGATNYTNTVTPTTSPVLADGDTIDTIGNNTSGIEINTGETMYVAKTLGEFIEIRTQGQQSQGILIQGGGTGTFQNDFQIETSGEYASGISVSGVGSEIEVNGSMNITAHNSMSYGINVENSGRATIGDTIISTGSTGTLDSYGIYVNNGELIANGKVTISGQGQTASGVLGINGNILFNDTVDIDVSGGVYTPGQRPVSGIYSHNSIVEMKSGGRVYSPAQAPITVGGLVYEGYYAIYVQGDVNQTSLVTGTGKFNISGNILARAINTTGMAITSSGKVDLTLEEDSVLQGNAQAIMDGEISLSLKDDSYMVGDIVVGGPPNVYDPPRVGNTTSHGIATLSFENQSKMIGNISFGAGSTSGNHYGAMTQNTINLTIKDQAELVGDIFTQPTGNVSGVGDIYLTLSDEAKMTGKTLSTSNGKIHVIVNDDSTWNLTGSSSVTDLSLSDQGTIKLSTSNSFSTLTAESLSGQGTFVMRTDMANRSGDLLSITGTSPGSTSGTHQMLITNQGSTAVKGDYQHLVVETADGGGTFALIRPVELGAWQYGLHQGNGQLNSEKNWYLYRLNRMSSMATMGINQMRAGALLNYSETDLLMQELGALREDAFRDKNIWAKITASKYDVDRNGMVEGFQQRNHGIQIGWDRHFEKNENTWHAGLTLGYTDSNQSYHSGSGETDSYYVGAYGIYQDRNDFYAAFLVKYGGIDQKLRNYDSVDQLVKGSNSSQMASSSLELGKRFSLTGNEKKSWYVEPQVRFTYGKVWGQDFSASNGLQMDFNSYNYFEGRLGARIGYKIENKKNKIHAYGKISYAQEFGDSKVKTEMNGETLSENFGKDHRFTYGAGILAELGSRHQVYLDIERAVGKLYTQSWAVNAGYRFQW